jgi:hypothetical protein
MFWTSSAKCLQPIGDMYVSNKKDKELPAMESRSPNQQPNQSTVIWLAKWLP